MIRAAIVGLGWWGKTIVDAVQGKSDQITFVAAHTRTRAKAEDYCREKNLDLRDDLRAVLKDRKIDAVVFTTPHSQHEEHVKRAARARKHVYVEKPFTLTARSARSALNAVQKAGVVLGVDYQRRFHPSFDEVRKRVRDGQVGTVCCCVAEATAPAGLFLPQESWRTNPEETPVGAMTALGVHLVDGFIDLCGEIERVYCVNARRGAPLVDDTTTVAITHSNGVLSSLVCSQATAGNYRVAVYGTRGLAETERNLDGFRFVPAPDKPGQPPAAQPEVIENKGVNPVKIGLEAFAAAIRGDAPFPITADQIVHGVAVFEAIVRSAKTGRPVEVRKL
ncbi:MAG: Gfo/Idh/MocA family oxidoreductase [Betaproteobacteria bacterium]|nr:Gfo/Idh/MocA family oxidoreductase [Betaproteobacteria bacterium]